MTTAFIPYGRQDITQEDLDAINEVLMSDFITQGPKVAAFEHAICAHTGARFTVAANSATSVLHMACMALGVGPGDVVWTVPTTFVASANCAIYCGADVDFVDIDPQRFTMCPSALEAKLAKCEKLPKVIIPVHLCGQSADMRAIHRIAEKHGIRIIEDASHAVGASYEGSPVGDCRYSDITVFSFHPVKIITTAEGGAATTNDERLAVAMGLVRSHGITRDESMLENESHGDWYYEQITLGFNYRMTEMQAALGVSQLSRLNKMISRRRELAARYDDLLKEANLTRPQQAAEVESSWHLYVIQVESQRRRAIFDHLRSNNIGVQIHYIPVHLQPFYRRRGFGPGDFPYAEAYYSRAISIPLYPGLTDEAQDRVISVLKGVL